MIAYTTLNKIKEYSPCAYGWKKLLAALGKTSSDDEQLSLLTILESNGLDDALWALHASDASDKDMRLFAVWCARQIQRLMPDPRSIAALDVAERLANGQATKKELDAANTAAYAAAYAAAYVAARDTQKARFIEVFCTEKIVMTVTVQELIDAVRFIASAGTHYIDGYAEDFIKRIKAEGIAPPEGYVLVSAELFNSAVDCVGRFVGDEGWGNSDMDTFDAMLAHTPKDKP